MFAPKEYWENWEAKEEYAKTKEEAKEIKKNLKAQGFTVSSKIYHFSDLGCLSRMRIIAMKDKTGTKTHKEIMKEIRSWF